MTNKEFKKLKDDLWLAANKLRADSDLKSNDYSPPVLGIIYLKDLLEGDQDNPVDKVVIQAMKDIEKHSEYDIRSTLMRIGIISAMHTLPGNMISTVTLSATLWFFDKAGQIDDFATGKDKIRILFVDARNVFHQVDRAHREFTEEQLQNLAEDILKSRDDKIWKALDKPKKSLNSSASDLEKRINQNILTLFEE